MRQKDVVIFFVFSQAITVCQPYAAPRGNMKLLFRAQHGDIGPLEVGEGDVTYEGLQERVFELWPKSTSRGVPVEREEEHSSTCPVRI